MTDIPVTFLLFVIVCVTSRTVGRLFGLVKFPLITGYLAFGFLAGSSGLGILPDTVGTDLAFVQHVCLAFISFSAGMELHLSTLRARFKAITAVSSTITLATLLLITPALLLLQAHTSLIAFPTANNVHIWACLLFATLMIARSPSSVIAVLSELGASGPYSGTALGVTMLCDVAVIVLFSLVIAFTIAAVAGTAINAWTVVGIPICLFVAFLLGVIVSWLLQLALSVSFGRTPLQKRLYRRVTRTVRIGLILGLGYVIFALCEHLREATGGHGEAYKTIDAPFVVSIEPLLACMCAAFFVANWSGHAEEMGHTLHFVGRYIYIAFFTLVGASLHGSALIETLPTAIAIFALRGIAVLVGSGLGHHIAGDKGKAFWKAGAWMGYLTQAGVALALAHEVAAFFPDEEWASTFNTTSVSVILINEILGPLGLKLAVRLSGEAKDSLVRRKNKLGFYGSVLVFGRSPMTELLAKRLQLERFHVVIVDRMSKEAREAAEACEAGNVDACALVPSPLESLPPAGAALGVPMQRSAQLELEAAVANANSLAMPTAIDGTHVGPTCTGDLCPPEASANCPGGSACRTPVRLILAAERMIAAIRRRRWLRRLRQLEQVREALADLGPETAVVGATPGMPDAESSSEEEPSESSDTFESSTASGSSTASTVSGVSAASSSVAPGGRARSGSAAARLATSALTKLQNRKHKHRRHRRRRLHRVHEVLSALTHSQRFVGDDKLAWATCSDGEIEAVVRSFSPALVGRLFNGGFAEDFPAAQRALLPSLPLPDVVVAALPTDEENYAVLRLVRALGASRMIARVANPEYMERFADLGVLVTEPTSALLSLVTTFVTHADPHAYAAQFVDVADEAAAEEDAVAREGTGRAPEEYEMVAMERETSIPSITSDVPLPPRPYSLPPSGAATPIAGRSAAFDVIRVSRALEHLSGDHPLISQCPEDLFVTAVLHGRDWNRLQPHWTSTKTSPDAARRVFAAGGDVLIAGTPGQVASARGHFRGSVDLDEADVAALGVPRRDGGDIGTAPADSQV
jgi:Kef-type K+ transport system membrane component KefB/Trk K+ transport system NAD-binding subunit